MYVDKVNLEEMVDSLSDHALLDKISLGGAVIEDIENLEELEKLGILTIGENKSAKYTTTSGKQFSNLKIKDSKIDGLKAGVFIVYNGMIFPFCNLSISVKNEYRTNLICNTSAQYKQQIEDIKNHLLKNYGITINFDNVFLTSIEINKTFRISENIGNYRRIFNLLAYNIPRAKRMNLVENFNKKSKKGFDIETFVISSKKRSKNKKGKFTQSKKYEEIIIYSKTKQIKKQIFLNDEFIRIEIKIVGRAKIMDLLDTNKFYEITDELINNFFDEEMNILFLKPYQLWKEKRDKKLLKIMKNERESDKQKWVVKTLLILENEEIKNCVPLLLDINELYPLIDKMDIQNRQRRYKIRKNFETQAKARATALCNGDDMKMNEILSKISTMSPHFGDTPQIEEMPKK